MAFFTGEDFSPALVEHVFEPGRSTVDQVLTIELVDDAVFENEEMFVVRLNVTTSDPEDEQELETGIQYLQLKIAVDPSDGNDVAITHTCTHSLKQVIT